MYTCNNAGSAFVANRAHLSPRRAPPEHDRTATELLWTQWRLRPGVNMASESDDQTEQHGIQVAFATRTFVTRIECALILQPQVVDLEEAPADAEAGVEVGRAWRIRSGEAAGSGRNC